MGLSWFLGFWVGCLYLLEIQLNLPIVKWNDNEKFSMRITLLTSSFTFRRSLAISFCSLFFSLDNGNAKRVFLSFCNKPPSRRGAFCEETGVENTTWAIFSLLCGVSSSDKDLEMTLFYKSSLTQTNTSLTSLLRHFLVEYDLFVSSACYCQYREYQFLVLDQYYRC